MSLLVHLWNAIGPGGEFVLALGGFVAGCAFMLHLRDLVRRRMLRRRAHELAIHPTPVMLAHGLVPCPECAEAILPQASQCPYCEAAVAPRDNRG
jgi:hypothetical protein